MEGHRQAVDCILRGAWCFQCTSRLWALMYVRLDIQGVADIENNTAKEMTKLSAVIQVPFRSGNQFLGEGGLQVRVSYPLRYTNAHAHAPPGCVLFYTRQDPHHRRSTCQPRSYYRQFHCPAPSEAPSGDQSAHQGVFLFHCIAPNTLAFYVVKLLVTASRNAILPHFCFSGRLFPALP